MIDNDIEISLCRQCQLLSVHRSGIYYTASIESDENLQLMRLMDEQRLNTPFYGIRRLTAWLKQKGYLVNKKRIKRLMMLIRWQTIYRKPNTSWKDQSQKVYPYLLKDLEVRHTNQVWAIDITYIPMKKGFMYLCAIIDLHTRYVVNWGLGNTMSAEWCCQIIEDAIAEQGCPGIINSDQGSQFTSEHYISLLKSSNIQISMDGKGRAIDNIFIERLWRSVKYECVYLYEFEDGKQLYAGLARYFLFYNTERLHQSLQYKTPHQAYRKAA